MRIVELTSKELQRPACNMQMLRCEVINGFMQRCDEEMNQRVMVGNKNRR